LSYDALKYRLVYRDRALRDSGRCVHGHGMCIATTSNAVGSSIRELLISYPFLLFNFEE
jgi:hypothetical protein